MKAYKKRIVDSHVYRPQTKRQKQNKVPKSADDRKGTKSGHRMCVKNKLAKRLDGYVL